MGGPVTPVRAGDERLLADVTWPRWARVGVPVLGMVSALLTLSADVRSSTQTVVSFREAQHTAVGSLLVVLSAVPFAAALVLRRWRPPLPAALGVVAPLAVLHVAGEWLGIADLGPYDPQLSLVLLLLVSGVATAQAPRAHVAVVVGASLATLVGRTLVAGELGPFVRWYLLLAAVVAAGAGLRSNFVAVTRLAAAREELARSAAADERRALARDVHDVVAHTLAVTMLHVTAARLAAERAPGEAVAALREAERHGRASMADLRRVVRLLQDEDAGTTVAALPTLADLSGLVASYDGTGVAVRCTVVGDPDAPSPVVGVALFRVAQEALANAARHGGAGADVRLAVGDGAARLEVRNPCRPGTAPGGPAPAPGSGLPGMAERVRALGGTFRAGPVPGEAAWELVAEVPA